MKPPRKTTGPPPGARRPPGFAAATSPGDDAARVVKAAYINYRIRWESLRRNRRIAYVPPKSYDGRRAVQEGEAIEAEVGLRTANVWKKLAAWFVKNEHNPVTFIRFVFDGVPYESRPPEPAQLTSDWCRDMWRRGMAAAIPEALIALRVQKESARTIIANRRKAGDDYVLACVRACASSVHDFSPLFRYCLAKSVSRELKARNEKSPLLAEVLRRLWPSAVLVYGTDYDIYRAAWGEILPKGFHERALAELPKLTLPNHGGTEL